MEIFTTPGFLDAAARHGLNFLPALALIAGRDKEPSMVIGKAGLKKAEHQDSGRTFLVPSLFDWYLIRDDYPDDAEEFAGQSILTFCLPEER